MGVLDFDRFQQETDKMEAFINQQWEKEQELAENDQKVDMFERALMFDEDQMGKDKKPKTQTKKESSKEEKDEFSFLNSDLFNLPKFANKTEEREAKEEERKMKEIDHSNMSKFELEELAIKQRIAKMEDANVALRSWEYQGEVSNNAFTHP